MILLLMRLSAAMCAWYGIGLLLIFQDGRTAVMYASRNDIVLSVPDIDLKNNDVRK